MSCVCQLSIKNNDDNDDDVFVWTITFKIVTEKDNCVAPSAYFV